MKTLIILFLICILTANAEDNLGIAIKVNERRNANGTLLWRTETTTRGKAPILRVHQFIKEGVTNTTRSYMIDGEMVMLEADEDGDGIFETVIVYRPGKSAMEVFARLRDGSVSPVTTQRLEAYKKEHAAITELWDKAFEKDMDADRFLDQLRATQRKIRDAEKESKAVTH